MIHFIAHRFLTLALASHLAAGFDGWTTWRAVSQGAVERNPMIAPMVNAAPWSALPLTQTGPVAIDLVARSAWGHRHSTVVKVARIAVIADGLGFGIHNLTFSPSRWSCVARPAPDGIFRPGLPATCGWQEFRKGDPRLEIFTGNR